MISLFYTTSLILPPRYYDQRPLFRFPNRYFLHNFTSLIRPVGQWNEYNLTLFFSATKNDFNSIHFPLLSLLTAIDSRFPPLQVYYIFYGPLTTGVSSQPVGHTTALTYVVGHLQQDIVYVFEVSVGLSGRHSDPVNSKPKSGS